LSAGGSFFLLLKTLKGLKTLKAPKTLKKPFENPSKTLKKEKKNAPLHALECQLQLREVDVLRVLVDVQHLQHAHTGGFTEVSGF
jgi:hypothetical protein